MSMCVEGFGVNLPGAVDIADLGGSSKYLHGLWTQGGKEDPVEHDSSLNLCGDTGGAA